MRNIGEFYAGVNINKTVVKELSSHRANSTTYFWSVNDTPNM
jgi:hypothetical protein